MLPVASTRNTPPGATLEELLELGGVLEREELTELLITLALERELLEGINEEELERLDGINEEELERLELTTLDELPQAAVTPKGEGWLAQVVLEIQLLLFS